MRLSTKASAAARSARVAILMMGFCAILSAAASPVQAQDAGVIATLAAARTSVASTEAVVVQLTLTNPGTAPVALLRWLVPEDGLTAPLFAVELDGKLVPYTGIRAKRAAPIDADYVFLGAGQTVTWNVDLTDAYDFSQTGRYGITYDVASADLFARASGTTPYLTSNSTDLFIEGHRRKVRQARASVTAAGTSYVGCTAAQQAKLINARPNAAGCSANGVAYLAGGTVDTHYTTWFGTYTSGRYATISSHFTNILGLLRDGAVIFDCTCTDPSVYAFVYPSDSTHAITLCGAFWQAPDTGTDSQMGTVVHEASHFNDIAATDDWVYGQAGARSLASTNPARAVDNADNHEYFCEQFPTAPATSTPTPAPTPTRTPAPTPIRTPVPTSSPGGGGACAPSSTTLCLLGGRFSTTLRWDDGSGPKAAWVAEPKASSEASASGLFFFYAEDPSNWEVLVKMIDGCATNGSFWTLVSASTGFGWELTVTDESTGESRTWDHPLDGRASGISDFGAFSGCGS